MKPWPKIKSDPDKKAVKKLRDELFNQEESIFDLIDREKEKLDITYTNED